MTDTDRPAGSLDPKLLEILVCPVTKGPLEYDATRQELVSRAAKLAYPDKTDSSGNVPVTRQRPPPMVGLFKSVLFL